ncbi:peptidase [Vibrio qinghaiensis]|uniref:Peptidase n=1 Tax=Vibrio qinghaiensis TaxID=2025808 RepID=A0A223MVD2_9VIBR|nr:PepSY-associated TM helix domain-containing protein [Vibrio qinghaiensis]ASU21542.1 peptidase [Vibrio qinghaiensis]
MFYKQRTFQLWARRLHIYVSMSVIGLMLFFAITGITLNRPDLFVKSQPSREQLQFTLPQSLLFEDERLVLNADTLLNYLTAHSSVRGEMSRLDTYTDYQNGVLQQGEVSASFSAPGYSAALYIDLTTAQAELDMTDYGFVAMFNDLHKGRHSGEVWKWVIDLSSVLMLVFILSGIALLLPKKSTLSYALRWCSLGLLLTFSVYWLAVP